ncbi:glycosyltransferase [Flavihumibacter petaseus]|uniref:Glycosyltransferase n=1 Tax=Flavihumibacter petaseus NBRC 106054 TaxID=1220578 RepID=A0A0E9MTF7_9BACT|nr:glycosyltransferase [Flavihumibacter petaseus]GAO41042.1 hypothetical protein FPE01S_01_00540 [Flavihumibacter petaseus NBRC 106054]
MKKVLYFFPLNPADRNSGSISRALSLLQYFRDRGYHVDFISKEHWGNYTPESKASFENARLANSLHVFRRKPVKTNPLTYFFGYKIGHLLYERQLKTPKGSIPNHTTWHLRRQFDAMLQRTRYDYVIISYAYWAHLVKDNPFLAGATTIIDTHDLLSAQHQNEEGFDRSVAIGDELYRLSFFDRIWTISVDETYLFSQFFPDRVDLVPMMIKAPDIELPPMQQRRYDLLYVATDNPHNLRSASWFFTEVYPKLDKNLRICAIGTIVPHLPEDLPNLEKISFAPDLRDYYSQAKIAICPMLSGTGVKIKVVEAMAYQLPVVCNERGIDGLPDKTRNGCSVTNDPVAFADAIATLLNDNNFYQQQSRWAFECFKNNFERAAVYQKLDNILENIAHGKSY